MPIAIPCGHFELIVPGGGDVRHDAEMICKLIVDKCMKAKADNPKADHVPRGYAKWLFELMPNYIYHK